MSNPESEALLNKDKGIVLEGDTESFKNSKNRKGCMAKRGIFSGFILTLLVFIGQSIYPSSSSFAGMKVANIYGFTAKDIYGKMVNFSDYKGKVMIMVNTARL